MKQNIDKFFNQWQQMPKKKQFFFIAWITGVILLGSALFLEHSSSSRSGDPLALLASTKGQVQYRDANELLWQSSSSNQRFFENDSIATGNSSLARIAFVGGRVLELGSNTQIKITRSISDDEETFSVDLVEGEVKALPVNQKIRQKIAQRLGQKSNSIKKDTELKIAAAGQTFSLLTEDAALTLQQHKKNSEIKIISAKKVEKISKGNKRETLNYTKTKIAEQNALANAKTPPPDNLDLTKLDAKKQQAKAITHNFKDTAGKIVEKDDTRKTKTSLRKLDALSRNKLKPKDLAKNNSNFEPKSNNLLLAAKSAPLVNDQDATEKLLVANPPQLLLPTLDFLGRGSILWVKQPLEAISGSSFSIKLAPPSTIPKGVEWIPVAGFGSKIYQGKSSFSTQEISVIPQSLGAKTVVSTDKFDELIFNIAPGVILEKEGKRLKDVEFGTPQTVRFRSLSNLSGPAILQLNAIEEKPWTAEFIPQHQSAAVSLYLEDASQFVSLVDFLSGSQGFAFKKSTLPLKGEGTFIVKNRRIVGAIVGDVTKSKGLNSLLRKLGGDLIFRGNATAYIGGHASLQKLMKSQALEKIYIAYENDFVGVNRNFLETNKEAKKFIMNQSSSYFTEPIKLLAPNEE